ncbi:hypothetical protein [Peredibacter starrii]|uniref:DUF1566 domain-containing protein n=1 Tax=Peredibacter starrii TaxID=28202 RepID=A0AAX4HJU5_9BACT|nr:hypothetical protein [Peredibacter starrii]WPU63508.1 hypothetical protein SOO65_12495 [Peredibacter starrii]
MKQYLLVAAMLAGLLFCLRALAAGEKGNGGYSIVCRDANGLIASAELLDTYEGRLLYKKTYSVDLNSVEELVRVAQDRVRKYVLFASKLNKEIDLIEKNLVFIPEGHELESTEDAFPVIKKKGCEFEQLANYTEAGEVFVSQEIFNRIDNLNRAALILHEAIYSIRRKALGETTSQNTRRLVAQLMAVNPDQAIIEKHVMESLQQPTHANRPCGLTGSIEERMENCSYQVPQRFNMVLVTRTENLKEVWLDVNNNILWSERLPTKMNFANAKEACRKVTEEMAFLDEFQWRLPSGTEFQISGESVMSAFNYRNGPEENNWYWSSTVKGRTIVIFNSLDSTTTYSPFTNSRSGSVRCVSPVELNF